MRTVKSLAKWTASIVMIAAFCLTGVSVQGTEQPPEEGLELRADIISIDTMAAFGKLERPPVVFLHGKHTEALKEEKGDLCKTCHLAEEERLSLKYQRLNDGSRQEVMDTYHLNCIECHSQRAAKGMETGPAECGACHVEKPVTSSRLSMAFDKSLHYRHAKAAENKCEVCHHEYNAKEKKLFYAKGKEGSCRYCHKEQTEENRISMQEASHLDCVSCHRQTAAQSKTAGPVECIGCHAPEKRQEIESVADVPRMERGQPDIVLLRASVSGEEPPASDPTTGKMDPVPFDHKSHESGNDTCIVCHHADLAACTTCHTQTGSEKGDGVTLEKAMHQIRKDQSCIGCHDDRKEDARCVGCHGFMDKGRKKDERSCKACHTELPEEMAGAGVNDKETARMAAATMLASRPKTIAMIDAADIPDKVKMGSLSKNYEPVELPHRKMIDTLAENLRDSKIAAVFHPDKGTLCQGCHHNSPPALKPPQCGSCHGKPFDEAELFKPGLMAAYHRQCMECHDTMGIAKPDSRDCTACHVKKMVR